MQNNNNIFLIMLIFSAILLMSCSKEIAEEDISCKDCNVIFISLTNLRADHLGMYGYDRDTSPNLDEFSKNSIVFENAFTVASWTLPVAMSTYTSTYPFTHKVMNRYNVRGLSGSYLPKDANTFVDILNEEGYETVSINAGKDYNESYGLTGRFDQTFTNKGKGDSIWNAYGSFNDIAPLSVQSLETLKGKKFFLHIQSYDTHCPFAYPRENAQFDPNYEGDVDFTKCYWTFDRTETVFLDSKKEKYYILKSRIRRDGVFHNVQRLLNERDIEHMVSLYDGEIYNSDSKIKEILDKVEELGLMDNTIIVFFSEHGDMFGKYGRFMRGGPLRGSFYDDVLHVPLMIYHPKLEARRLDKLFSLVDLAPTMLDFLGIGKPPEFRGRSFANALDKESIVRENIFSGSLYLPWRENTLFNNKSVVTAIRDSEWKLTVERIKGSGETNYELFNIRKDPEELVNLKDKESEKLMNLNNSLNSFLESEFNTTFDTLLKRDIKNES